ncbi:endonuclease [Portibacter lacus]|uniref:Endonuclease I n=1 Tax=Portibacter lacus TaxID=1099794 RepID=A0AA37SLM7_9BACT|nr:endonuclease [Portibacter lacus]GLR16561.1 hypothetical protein GCM10007940_11760 [Portibacter lacus]
MKSVLVFSLLLVTTMAIGQYQQTRLFPGAEGDELIEMVLENYKSEIVFFDYGKARDTMFRNVYAVNDSLKCVYSGHTLYLDPNEDPTTFVYMEGSANGINTEHSYPRSKGAGSGNAESDMHHLYPTRSKVNEVRSNSPFGEIPDASTDTWFYKNQAISSIPTQNIDKYSEYKSGVFEPREDFKGNIARAMMYFYTMYKDAADAADPDFFWDMLPTLCEWHFQDPVDSAEYVRTNLIAKWQEYPNPFILDCSLASRSYCSITNEACELLVPVKELAANDQLIKARYSNIQRSIMIETPASSAFHVYDINGRKIKSLTTDRAGQFQIPLDQVASGIYVLQSIYRTEKGSAVESIMLNVF